MSDKVGDEPILGRWPDEVEELEEVVDLDERPEPLPDLFLADALLESYEYGDSAEPPCRVPQPDSSAPVPGVVSVEMKHLAACLARARVHQDAKDREANATRFAEAEAKLLAEIPSLAVLAGGGAEMASGERIEKLIDMYGVSKQTWNEVARALSVPETLRSAQENLARSLGLEATASLDEINFEKDVRSQFSIDAIVSEVRRELSAMADAPEKHLARRCPDGSVTVLRRKLVVAPPVEDRGYSIPTTTAGGALACGAAATALGSLGAVIAVVAGAAALAAGAAGARAAYNAVLLKPSDRWLTRASSTAHVRALQKSLEELGVRCEFVKHDGRSGKRYGCPYLSLLVTVSTPGESYGG